MMTFHPSYSYEDFVEGFRPRAAAGGINYVTVNGPFKNACQRCLEDPGPSVPMGSRVLGTLFTPGELIHSSSGMTYEVHHVDDGALILKNVTVRGNGNQGQGYGLLTPLSLWLVDRVRQMLGPRGLTASSLSMSGTRKNERMANGKTRGEEIVEWTGVDGQSLFSMTGPLRAVSEAVAAKLGQAAPPEGDDGGDSTEERSHPPRRRPRTFRPSRPAKSPTVPRVERRVRTRSGQSYS